MSGLVRMLMTSVSALQIDDSDAMHIAVHTKLSTLELEGRVGELAISADFAAGALSPLSALEHLQLAWATASFDDAALQPLRHLPLLYLRLYFCEGITACGLASLAGCSRLQHIELRGCPQLDAAAAVELAVRHLPALYSLNLGRKPGPVDLPGGSAAPSEPSFLAPPSRQMAPPLLLPLEGARRRRPQCASSSCSTPTSQMSSWRRGWRRCHNCGCLCSATAPPSLAAAPSPQRSRPAARSWRKWSFIAAGSATARL